MDAEALRMINGQLGTLVMNHGGEVMSSTGELSDSAGEKAAKIVFDMLQDASSIFTGTADDKDTKPEALNRMIVEFPSYDFAVTLDGNRIYVVKRSTAQE